MASLSNVILLHVSAACLPRTEKQRQREVKKEYYHILGLPLYSSAEDIRKAYRHLSLQIQCDRMTVEWHNNNDDETTTNTTTDKEQQLQKIDAFEKSIKNAFRILGDKHLRQQYHLLECSPSRYAIINGKKKIYDKLLSSTYLFPYIVMQSVLLYVPIFF